MSLGIEPAVPGAPDGVQLEDPVLTLTRFASRLRMHGLSIDPSRIATAIAGLAELGLDNPANVYWSARAAFCGSLDDLRLFDLLFAGWLSATPELPAAKTPGEAGQASSESTSADGAAAETWIESKRGSPSERLTRAQLARLNDADRAELTALTAALRAAPVRRSLRRRSGGADDVDLSATVNAMLRDGGELMTIARDRPAVKPRRVVLLVDVSGSMLKHAEALLRFAHAAVQASPRHVEAFALGTRLTRLTQRLRPSDPQVALDAAAELIADWRGGTRLAEGLREFIDKWGRRGTARRAVVVVCSDGMVSGDAKQLGAEAARLRRLAHAVVWADPYASRPDIVGIGPGLNAVKPHVDRFLPVGTHDARLGLAAALAAL